MTASDRRGLIVGLLLLVLLLLAACGAAATGPGEQHTGGARAIASPSASAMAPIIVSNKPQSTLKPTATPAPSLTTPMPASIDATPTPTPTSIGTPPTPTPTSASTNPTPTPSGSQSQLAQYVFGLVNQDRAAKGLAAYAWSDALAGGAHLHNLNMIAYGKLSHQCPGEADLGTRITNDGLKWRAAAENIGWSNDPNAQLGLLSVHQSMMAEQPPNDGHRQNILSTTSTLIGIDVVVDAQQQVWLTEDFALV